MLRSNRAWALAAIAVFFTILVVVGQTSYPSGVFNPSSALSAASNGASAAVLADGTILITGGTNSSGALNSAEIIAGSSVASMTTARSGHVSVALKDGRVLVTGGLTAASAPTNSAEIFNPAANSWTQVLMGAARAGATATLLADGRVAVIGGDGAAGGAHSTMEIFDPATNSFASSGALPTFRTNHAAALLNDGRIVVAGGSNGTAPVAEIDIYDPASASVSVAGTMGSARQGLSASTLLHGKVLLAGGNDGSADLASTEIFDPSNNSIAVGPAMSVARNGHAALVLPNNNTVLMTGGSTTSSAAEIFVEWQNAFAPFGTLSSARTAVAAGASGQTGAASVAGGVDSTGTASAAVDTVRFPMVKTDKPDYQPGNTATITGSGFGPNETVNISLVEVPDDGDGPHNLTPTTDSTGAFSTTFAIDQSDLDIRFYLTAAGGTSGLTAGMTFTDSAPYKIAINATGGATGGTFLITYVNNGTQTKNASQTTNLANLTVDPGSAFSITSIQSPVNGQNFLGTIGVVTSTTGSASISAGTITGTAGSSGDSMTITLNYSATTSQTITVDTPAPVSATYGSSFNVAAHASSGLAVSVAGSGGCSGSGTTTGVGSPVSITMTSSTVDCTVTYSQAGNGSFSAATNVTNSTTASKATLTYTATGSKPYGSTTDNSTPSGYATLLNGDTMPVAGFVAPVCTSATGAVATAPVGTYTINCTAGAATNYIIAAANFSNAFTVSQVQVQVVLANASPTYNGASQTITPTTLTPASASSVVVLTYTSVPPAYNSTVGPTNAGTYTLTATLSDTTNYTFTGDSTLTATLTIQKATPVFSGLSSPTITYGTTPTSLGGTLSSGALIPTGNVSITLNGGTAQNASITAGTGAFSSSFVTGSLAASTTPYAIVYHYGGDANFNAVSPDGSGSLTVNKVQVQVVLASASPTYNGASQTITPTTLTPASASSVVVLTYTSAAPVYNSTVGPTNAGTYTLTATLSDTTNYTFTGNSTLTATLTIQKATLTYMATGSKTYGLTTDNSTPSGFATFYNGDTALTAAGFVAPVCTSATGAVATAGVGTYTINCTAGSATNYTIAAANFLNAFTVNKATLTYTATGSKTYGSTTDNSTPSGFATFYNGDTALTAAGFVAPVCTSATGAAATAAVGTYTINCMAGSATNYTIAAANFLNAFTVTKLTLNGSADNKNRQYDTSDPAFTVTLTGFLNGATQAVFSGTPSCSAGDFINSPVASYTITCTAGSLMSMNYAVGTISNGSLSITQAPLLITAANTSRFFGVANPAVSYTPSVTVVVDTNSVGLTGVTCSTSATYGLTYPVGGPYAGANTCSGGVDPNYSISYAAGSLTINLDTTAIVYTGPTTSGYGQCGAINLSATLTNAILGGPVVGATITFNLGTQTATAVTDATGTANVLLTVTQGVGTPTVGAVFAGNLTLAPSAAGPITYTITPGVAGPIPGEPIYTGPDLVWTSGTNSSTATATLSATIKDKNSCSGDIRTANVTFAIRNSDGSYTPIPSAQHLSVGLVSPTDPTVGTASAIVQLNTGSGGVSQYDIAVIIGGNYSVNDPADDQLITVAQPGLANSMIGSGNVDLKASPAAAGFLATPSAGTLLPAGPWPLQVAALVQYNKSGTNPHGSVVLQFNSYNKPNGTVDTALHTYQITSNSIASLTAPIKGVTLSFTAKCNVVDITNPTAPISVDGGATMQVTTANAGTTQGGTNGTVNVEVQPKAGGLWIAAGWNGTMPQAKPLISGSIVGQ